MGRLSQIVSLLPLTDTLASAVNLCLSGVTWGDPRLDLFGLAPDDSIWHKFYTGYDWQPKQFERIPSAAASCPSVSSWGDGRLDIVWPSTTDGNVLHKYFDGGSWGPSWEDAVDLGGEIDLLDTSSWGKGRLDIVGNALNGSYMHKAWTGTGYFPEGKVWEDLGGNFYTVPSIVSWGENRLDVVGVSAIDDTVWHKYWNGYEWSKWEDLGGGPFLGNVTITSWGEYRLDIWGVDEEGLLNHKYWDGYQWNGWEKMGGAFAETPQVVHWDEGRIDIVGHSFNNNKYLLKSFDGGKWNPSLEDWYPLSGPYASEPLLVAKTGGQNFLYLFGINGDDEVRMQIWSGHEWQPSAEETWTLGNIAKPYPDADEKDSNHLAPETQHVLLGSEL